MDNENGIARKQFTFYRSYFDAIRVLPKKEQTAVLLAICSYALDGEEPKLSGTAGAIFTLVRPTLDASRKKANSGKKGGEAESKREAEQKHIESKTQANGKQTASEKENEKEYEKENEKEYECTPPTPSLVEKELSRLSPALRSAMEKWLKYKQERREAYKPTGLTALVSQVINEAERFGEQAVADVVERSMASNYAGIVFDRLSSGIQQKPAQNKPKPGGNVFLELLEDGV